MPLVLEIEHLARVAFAAIGPDSDAPDWPPQPDRIFSALVATWASRGESEEERLALEWLESLPEPPAIVASDAFPRTAPVSFVPPNDPQTGRVGNTAVLPALRRRQPRRFPAARPHDPVVQLYWTQADPDDATLAALGRLAADTAYVGHSASLTRCRFTRAVEPPQETRAPRRRIYPGRLAELRSNFSAGRRPSPGDRVLPRPGARPDMPRSVFGENWLLLEHDSTNRDGGDMPDIRASAIVAKAIRDTLLSGYNRAGLGDRVPEIVSGHAADGSPTREPHLAIVPLAFAGFAHADGRVLGFALVPPRGSDILDDDDFRRALRTVAPIEKTAAKEQPRRVLRVGSNGKSGSGPGFYVGLSPTLEPNRRSLNSALYTRPARTLATVTPIALDRHLKEKGEPREDEVIEQIAAACGNIGLDPALIERRPDGRLAIYPNKHSAMEGAPPTRPSGKSPAWLRWRLPASLASRTLTHAVIRFSEPVEGPVVLGAGRFVGLGLCRPLNTRGSQA